MEIRTMLSGLAFYNALPDAERETLVEDITEIFDTAVISIDDAKKKLRQLLIEYELKYRLDVFVERAIQEIREVMDD